MLLKVMYIIYKKDFLPVMPIKTVMQVQERHQCFLEIGYAEKW